MGINKTGQVFYVNMLMFFLSFLQALRDTWRGNIAAKLDKIHEARTRVVNTRKTYTTKKGAIQEGNAFGHCLTAFRNLKCSSVDLFPLDTLCYQGNRT